MEEISIMILHNSAPHCPAKCLAWIKIEEETFGRTFRRGRETRADHRRSCSSALSDQRS